MKSVISGGRCGSGIIGEYGGLGQKRGFGIPAHPKFYHGLPSIPRILRTEHRSSAIVIRPDGASSRVPGGVGEVATRSSLPLIQANLEGNFFGTLRFLCTLHKIHVVRFALRISGVDDCRQLQVSYPIPQIHPSHQISPHYIFHLSILGYFQLRYSFHGENARHKVAVVQTSTKNVNLAALNLATDPIMCLHHFQVRPSAVLSLSTRPDTQLVNPGGDIQPWQTPSPHRTLTLMRSLSRKRGQWPLEAWFTPILVTVVCIRKRPHLEYKPRTPVTLLYREYHHRGLTTAPEKTG